MVSSRFLAGSSGISGRLSFGSVVCEDPGIGTGVGSVVGAVAVGGGGVG